MNFRKKSLNYKQNRNKHKQGYKQGHADHLACSKFTLLIRNLSCIILTQKMMLKSIKKVLAPAIHALV